jgi:hypothetical protein
MPSHQDLQAGMGTSSGAIKPPTWHLFEPGLSCEIPSPAFRGIFHLDLDDTFKNVDQALCWLTKSHFLVSFVNP